MGSSQLLEIKAKMALVQFLVVFFGVLALSQAATTTPTAAPVCVDFMTSCAQFADQCQNEAVKSICCATCTETCQDSMAQCPVFAAEGFCLQFQSVRDACCKS